MLLDEIAGLQQGGNPQDMAYKTERAIFKEAADVIRTHANWRKRYPKLVGRFEASDVNDRDRRIAASTFIVMQNQERYIEGLKRQWGEATVVNALGPLAPSLMDVVRIFFPNMIANLVAEIQPITTPNSSVLTIKPRYTNTAAGVNAGDEVFRKFTDGTYASDTINVQIGTGNGSTTAFGPFNLSPTPIRPGTVLVLRAGASSGSDDGNGNVVGSELSAGTVNYASGALSVTFNTAPAAGQAINVQFRYDYEQNVNNLRGVDIGINMVPVNAKPHPLQIIWSIGAELAAASQYQIDIESTVGDLGTQLIRKERDWAVVNRIAAAATLDSTLNFNCGIPSSATTLTKKQHFQDWGLKLTRANSLIFNTNQRGTVSFVIGGINACDVIQQQANFTSEPKVVPIGAYKIGTLDGVIDVIKDSNLDQNTYIFGFRGMQLGDAAMIIAEWIPIFLTPVWRSPSLQGQQGLLSMYDILLNNPSYYFKGTLSGYQA